MCFDGKYVSVKGYAKDIPVIYGIDYLTHDVPDFKLVPSESYLACKAYFTAIKNLGYDLKFLVGDDNPAIKRALEYVFPNAIFQLCLNHYKESIRRDLGIRTSGKYREFYLEVEDLFNRRLNWAEIMKELAFKFYPKYKNCKDEKILYWMTDIVKRKRDLTNYHQLEGVPNTNNLIEAYNSHLKQRLKAIKGFENFKYASMWLNGYFLRRRLKPFTDCTEKFKALNGNCSLKEVLKQDLKLPDVFQITNRK